MQYAKAITVPANTLASAPQRDIIPINKGLINRVFIYFPPGSAGLLHIKVLDSTFQLYPSSLGETLWGDNIPFDFDDTYLKESEPYELIIESYNEDDYYAHKALIIIYQLSKAEYIARYLPTVASELISKITEAALVEQQETKTAQIAEAFEALKRIKG